jgi:restriction system protein
MYKNDVNSAFEILLEEIETVVESLNKEGEAAFKKQNYDKAKKVIEDAARLTAFREKIRGLQKEWRHIHKDKIRIMRKGRRNYGKLKKGLRTTEDEFRIPILKSLVEMGGKGEMRKVLEKIYPKMKGRLNRYDMDALSSNSTQRRWENTAQWCRNTMVMEGLLSSNSPRGIWEITAKGKTTVGNSAKV